MKLLPALAMLAITVVFRGLMNSSGSSYVWISVFTMSVGIITSVVSIIGERKKYKKTQQTELFNMIITWQKRRADSKM